MNSLLQHIKRKHSNINVLQNAEWNQGDDERNDLELNDDDDMHVPEPDVDEYEDERHAENQYYQNFGLDTLKKLAFSMIIKLKSTSSVPFSAIKSVINGTKVMFKDTLA